MYFPPSLARLDIALENDLRIRRYLEIRGHALHQLDAPAREEAAEQQLVEPLRHRRGRAVRQNRLRAERDGDFETLAHLLGDAVMLGADPALPFAATAPMPEGLDELLLAGFLRRERVELVKCVTNDLEVPANAQIILEGYVEPGERRREGPFGDHTGFYSLADDFPVFHLTCMTTRRNPVYLTTVVGRPPMEDLYLGKASERIFLPLIRKTIPEIVDMHFPAAGIFHNIVLVSIDKRYPGHARKIMSAFWGLGQLMFSKCIVVVDKDVNVQDENEVA